MALEPLLAKSDVVKLGGNNKLGKGKRAPSSRRRWVSRTGHSVQVVVEVQFLGFRQAQTWEQGCHSPGTMRSRWPQRAGDWAGQRGPGLMGRGAGHGAAPQIPDNPGEWKATPPAPQSWPLALLGGPLGVRIPGGGGTSPEGKQGQFLLPKPSGRGGS